MKLFPFLLCIFFTSSLWARGELFLIGGGKRTDELVQKIVEISRGKVLIIPLASEIPDEVAASVKAELMRNGADKVVVYDTLKGIEQIKNTNLIFFTGGSQVRLMNAMAGTEALKLIRDRFQKDLSLAGTSAGTAIMSEIMLTGESDLPYASGFGFMKKVILDQHFLKRNRQARLIKAIHMHPEYLGIGVDESTAIHVKDDFSFEVYGVSDVLVYRLDHGSLATYRVSPGESFFF